MNKKKRHKYENINQIRQASKRISLTQKKREKRKVEKSDRKNFNQSTKRHKQNWRFYLTQFLEQGQRNSLKSLEFIKFCIVTNHKTERANDYILQKKTFITSFRL